VYSQALFPKEKIYRHVICSGNNASVAAIYSFTAIPVSWGIVLIKFNIMKAPLTRHGGYLANPAFATPRRRLIRKANELYLLPRQVEAVILALRGMTRFAVLALSQRH
jgi:hypothetical protein